MAKRESDPVEVIKIEKPTETISSLGASTCSCKLQNDILLFGKKGLMMAVTIDKGELNVIHQISISGNIDQMWYQPQMKLLICIINKKLESFVLDLNKKASAEVFKRITSKQIKNVGPFECFSPFVKKGIVYIAAVDNRKKSGITIIESKPDGIFYTETKVWNADDKIVGCCFVNQHLVLVYQTKIQIITFFGKSDVITEKSINPFKGKPRFLPLQTYQILVHTGTCVYLIDETTINLIPNDYPVITISEMSPFVFFMQEFAQNKFYITYRLEPMTHSSTPSREFRRPEYIKGSFMHDSFPVFISSSYKQLIYFTPNPKWYETAIQNGHYQSAIEFITMLGNNSNENSEKFKQCAYTLGVINKVIEFYNDESNRTFQSIVTILNDFKMGNVSPKNVLIFLVLFIFQDYLPELFIHFKDWFPVSLENWKKDIVKSFPSGLVKNLQDSIDDLLRKRSSLLGEDNALTLVHHFNAQGHTVGDVIQQIITYLFAVKSQMTTTSDTTEVCENKTLFFTSFLVIVYFHSPNCKEMFDLLKMTKYLQKAVVLDMLKEQTTTNTKLLVEYYINQNHIDGVFNTPGIEYYDKRNATMRILSNTEITDNTKVTDKIMLLICEKLSLIGVQFTNQINEKISDELYLIFGKDKSRFSVTSVCDVIEHWDLSPLALHPSESTELRYRLSALYSDVRLGTTSDPAIAQVYINKVIKYLEIASQTNVLPYGGFVERFIDTIDQFPSLASAIKLEEVNCKAYKPRAAIGKLRGMDLLNLLLETVVELQKDEESLELIYDTAIESLVKFMTTLYNQKKFIQSVSSESVLQLLYSEEIRNIVKREYYPLRSVDNLFAEISLLIFTSDAPLETYFRFHNVLIEKMLPGLTLRFIWDIADPTMFPVAEDDNTIKRELKLFKESNGIKSILEGVICYLEKKKKLEGTLLTDCYLQYLSLQGIDRLDVTSKLMEQMTNSPPLQRHIGMFYDTLPWRLRCRIQHSSSKSLGLLEHFKQMKAVYTPTFTKDLFDHLDEFLRGFDASYEYDGTSGSIAKTIRLIRQNYRPFNRNHPSHVGAEVVLYCVGQVNNLTSNTSPLLAFLIHLLLEKNNEHFENPFSSTLAIELFTRFYPVIPLKFTENELRWLGVDSDKYDLDVDIESSLFSKILEGISSFDELQSLLPAIYSCARTYFNSSIHLSAMNMLYNALQNRYEVQYKQTICNRCHHRIYAGEAFYVVDDGVYAHEHCPFEN